MAAALGDPDPTSAQYVLTRRHAATHASSGATVNTNQPVYMIVLTGNFETGPVGPAPGHIITGRFATEILDARTGRDTDFGIGSQRVSIRSLGLVGNLLPYMLGSAIPACSAPDLRASAAFQGATGSLLGGISVTNLGKLACRLPMNATVSLSWHGRPLAVKKTRFPAGWLSRMNPRWSHNITVLAPRSRAQVILQWSNWCGAAPNGATRNFRPTISAHVPNQAAPIRAITAEPVLPPYCHTRPDSGTGSTIRVSPFVAVT